MMLGELLGLREREKSQPVYDTMRHQETKPEPYSTKEDYYETPRKLIILSQLIIFGVKWNF